MPAPIFDFEGGVEDERRIGRPTTRSDLTNGTKPGAGGLKINVTSNGVMKGTAGNAAMIDSPPLPLLKDHRQLIRDAGSTSIPISSSPSRSRSRAPESDADDMLLPTSGASEQLRARARRRKKKASKKKADPAMKTVRGFDAPTPSGDEDSDFSSSYFQKRDHSAYASLTSSPLIRPDSAAGLPTPGGISSLRNQLGSLEMEPTPGNPAVIRMKRDPSSQSNLTTGAIDSEAASDAEVPEMISYEVPLENDFVSADAPIDTAKEPLSPDLASVHRKMTAADFDPVMVLGQGSFGIVHMVKHKATGKLYAQKMFRKASLTVRKALVEQTKTERAILESINRHPFVVKLYYAFQDRERLYLVLEYAQGGELFTYLANEHMFPEATACFYMAELVLALEHLHHNIGVVYRDLKPENCLLDAQGHLLLTDFGLSKVPVDENDRCTSILGTVEYMAPEVILGHVYDRAVDWWSFGILGFDLLTGSPPFVGNDHAKIQQKVLKAKITFPYFIGPDAKDLLTRLLRKEPSKRLGAQMPKDIQTIKKHRFFKTIDWKRLEKRELEPPIKPLITDPELGENFASEFTSMALSPRKSTMDGDAYPPMEPGTDPFGGFSFVASPTLLRGFLS